MDVLTAGIYCDLGPTHGAGHLVRSAAIGAALVRAGARVELAAELDSVPWTRGLVGGYGIEPLQCAGSDSLAALADQRGWDVLVVDSYIVTAAELEGVRAPILAIDDQSLRPLPAKTAVNQNLSSFGLDYGDWPTDTVLRGPRFAPLRPEFAAARPATYPSYTDASDQIQNVLVVCGGTDAAGVSSLLVKRALGSLGAVHVRVIAATKSAATAIDALAVPSGSSVTILDTAMDIAGLMSWADLALTTSGTTVWELCCLGVPMALVRVAANQNEHYQSAIAAGVAVGLGTPEQIAASNRLPNSELLNSPAALMKLGERAWQTVDGLGATRVAEAALALTPGLILRAASLSDSAALRAWRDDPSTRQASRNTAEVSLDDHEKWLRTCLADATQHLVIAEIGGVAVGSMRYHELDGDDLDEAVQPLDEKTPRWEVGITIGAAMRGRGLAAQMLRAGHIWLRERYDRGLIVGVTRPSNTAMLRSFDRCGYIQQSRDDTWVTLHRPL